MSSEKKFNLKDRTLLFGQNVVSQASKLPRNVVANPLISQFVRSGTSVGANYYEADNAESRKDFIHKSEFVRRSLKNHIIGWKYC